jgi:hypothetical protein
VFPITKLLTIPWAVALALIAEPKVLSVPDTLLARTSMPEPSGIVWSAALSRYLVVSDDTGEKESGTNHAPWLFALDRTGVFDREPIPIVGLDQLNDAEALCQGPEGSLFLATSHSANRKGHDKKKRRRLYQLSLVGRELKILGSIDLAQAIAESAVVGGSAVDIEALAFHNGQLYVGLKAPQNAKGAAYILRIAEVLPALKSGVLSPSQIERWAELPLLVDGENGRVIQGVSDMSFLSDGSVVILANSPKKMPADGGGALWWRKTDGSLHLLRRFPGLKPEGVTTSPDGKSLVIVFDNDRKLPLWIHQDLPLRLPPASPSQR